MYDINLIRKRIVPERRKKVIFSLISFSVMVYALTFLGVVCFSFVNFKMIEVYGREIDGLQDDLSVLYPGTPTHEELSAMLRKVAPELKEIDGLLSKRTPLAAAWGSIARAVPDGVWLDGVRVTATEADAQKKKGRGESRSGGGLVITGYVMADRPSGGSDVIGEFTEALEKDSVVSELFTNLKSAETGLQRAGRTSVVGFEIKGDLKH